MNTILKTIYKIASVLLIIIYLHVDAMAFDRPEIQLLASNSSSDSEVVQLSEYKAILISFGLTTVNAGLLAVVSQLPNPYLIIGSSVLIPSILITPSAGSVYAGDYERVRRGTLTRIIIAATTATIISLLIQKDEPMIADAGSALIGAIGFVIFSKSTINDIFFSSRLSVQEYNANQLRQQSLSINPWISNHGIGLMIRY